MIAEQTIQNQERYRSFCRDRQQIPLFLQDWWLDVVYDGEWDALIVGIDPIVAVMPYKIRSKYGFRMITPPPLSPISGCWIDYPEEQLERSRIDLENKIMGDLAQQIDKLKVDWFVQQLSPSMINWSPFYWSGFKQTTRYTCQLRDLSDEEALFRNFSRSVRRNIARAESKLHIGNIGTEEFYRINLLPFERQKLTYPYSKELVGRILEESLQRGQARVIAAYNDKEEPIATSCMVWDNQTAYWLLGGMDASSPDKNGAKELLAWSQIQYARSLGGRIVDFEGSMLQPVAEFYRGFNPVLTPYHKIEKNYSLPLYLLRKLLNK